ncbi:hypothetical protein F4861DRAFT_143548 [Xylaria intraflava]|nr:hypothetical protein F4861DRAFT_143548 [Xylaria intraflava]
MAELSRVAQTTIRSTCLLFQPAPIQSRLCRNLAPVSSIPGLVSGRSRMSITSGLRSTNRPMRSTRISASPSRTQLQPYSSSNGWDNLVVRGTRANPDANTGINIKKPDSAAYDSVFDGQKETETSNEDSTEPLFNDSVGLDLSDIAPQKSRFAFDPMPAPQANLRLVPRTGRTVHVKGNVDVAKSFKNLALQVAQNRLRHEARKQKFHERPGMKRKREKSARWQRRFRVGFRAAVSRVRELTAQGW